MTLRELLHHATDTPLFPLLGLHAELKVRRPDFEAVGVDAFPEREGLRLLVHLEVKVNPEELHDLREPLPGRGLIRRDEDDVVREPVTSLAYRAELREQRPDDASRLFTSASDSTHRFFGPRGRRCPR